MVTIRRTYVFGFLNTFQDRAHVRVSCSVLINICVCVRMTFYQLRCHWYNHLLIISALVCCTFQDWSSKLKKRSGIVHILFWKFDTTYSFVNTYREIDTFSAAQHVIFSPWYLSEFYVVVEVWYYFNVKSCIFLAKV